VTQLLPVVQREVPPVSEMTGARAEAPSVTPQPPWPGPGAAFFQGLLESHQVAIVVTGADGLIRYATPAARRILGRRAAAGARLLDLAGGTGHDAAAALDRGGADTWELPGEAGEPACIEVRARDLRADPAVGGIVFMMRDVTGERRAVEALRRQAFHDPLTGLANRALFNEESARALARRGGRLVAVLAGDLDGFKPVNDTYGHPAGDKLLVAVAAALTGAVRPSDLVARVGGDEFAVLLDDLSDRAEAGALADRVIDGVAKVAVQLTDGTARVGISVGVAVTRSGAGGSADEFLGQADAALYAAKAAGKRTWRQHAPGMPGEPPAAPAPGEASTQGSAAGLFSSAPQR
jgi:diguanylate cyclase (GGDEF)-like protein